MNFKNLFISLSLVLLGVLFLLNSSLHHKPRSNTEEENQKDTLQIMAYSSFVQKWGAGPEIAKIFERETGTRIEWINAGGAGLILERLKFKNKSNNPDVVLGLDQFLVQKTSPNDWMKTDWLKLEDNDPSLLPKSFSFPHFIPYDWSPLGFVYEKGKINPVPESFSDLVKNKTPLILQDPRISSPGLQFLIWILVEMENDKAFEFLKQIKASTLVAPSWSASYSLFKMKKNTMVFSYMTSPLYHKIYEKNPNYRMALFKTPHPVQVEYVGIPKNCKLCKKAKLFVKFLRRADIQKIIMEKNIMLPLSKKALSGFEIPKELKWIEPEKSLSLAKKKKELADRWKKVFY